LFFSFLIGASARSHGFLLVYPAKSPSVQMAFVDEENYHLLAFDFLPVPDY
jgi:hypothetical protein